MKKILLFVGLQIVQWMFIICPAQNISSYPLSTDSVPFGLKPDEWNKMQEVWSRNNRQVKVLLSDGNSLEGHILYLYNDTVVLYIDRLSFINQYAAGNDIMYLHQDSFINISHDPEFIKTLKRPGLFWGTTAGVAAGAGLFFAGGGWIHPVIIAVPILAGAGTGGLLDYSHRMKTTEPQFLDLNSEKARERYVLFPDYLPGLPGASEHGSMLAPESFATADFDDLLNASPLTRSLFGTPVISLSGHTGLTTIEKNHSSFGLNVGFSFTYRPLTRLKVGYLYNQVMPLEDPLYEYTDYSFGLDFHQRVCMIFSHTLLVKFVPLTANQFLTNRFEASAGIGASLNKLYHQSHIWHNELWEVLSSEDGTFRNISLKFMSDLDFYVSRNFSIYLSINKAISKPFKPKDLTAVDPLTNMDIFFETREVYPSPLDIMIGLRFHFLRR